MHLPEPLQLHAAAVAIGDGVVMHDTAWRLNDRNKREEITLEVIENGTVTSYSIQVKQSRDGVAWYDVGTAISAAGVTTITGIKMPQCKAEIEAIVPSTGDVDVWAV